MTFTFLNAAPQWQPFNGAHWGELEDKVRFQAKKVRLVKGSIKKNLFTQDGDLKIWTGSHGVLRINNKEIFLAPDGSRRLPVPK